MPFFHYSQNNSGGGFDYEPDTGISCNVIIEAESSSEANDRARRIGMYFDGVPKGYDCGCCGDRWYETWRDEGDTEPMIYGRALAEHKPFHWHSGYDTFVHYADGRIVGHFPNIRKGA